ncbi:MAG: histidinol-phosphatase [Gammaproteobacteria bacterium]|nr:histidinol-phosphatase [Gammaproteobacteria bacterium]
MQLQRYKGDVSQEKLETLVEFAKKTVVQAGKVVLKGFRTRREFVDKSDGSDFDPVTASDRNGEKLIRDAIAKHWPEHGVLGEEFGHHPGNGLTWVMDPIDGTRAFVSGLLHWGVLLSLYDGRNVLLGAMYQPYVEELYWGTEKESHMLQGGQIRRLQTSDCTDISEAILSTTDPRLFQDPSESDAFRKVENKVRLCRYGGDCYQYGLVAMGFIDVVIENSLNPWDIQALIPIVRGAGGCISTWDGNDPCMGDRAVATCSKRLHEQVLNALNSAEN